ncbi:MAG: hypothetical protein EOO04_20400 [Chitinophagaceae bacterium]|nr:MAG: hypothetical protein EOO04_20400 [Chitinophagaceae bacterium]
MNYLNYVAPGLSIILCAYLLWAGYRRPNKKHKHLRAFAGLAAITSLYLLYRDLSANHSLSVNEVDEIIILTPGSSADTVNKLLAAKPGLKVYTTEPEIAAANRNAILIEHVNEISGPGKKDPVPDSLSANQAVESAPKKIHLLGYGLAEDELNRLHNKNIVFHPPYITRHFNSVNWNRQLHTGEKLVVQGSYNNNEPGKLNLILTGFNTILDSVSIPGNQLSSFQLQTIPKQKGRAVYTILVLDGKDTIHREKIPFETISSEPINILMLASSPDFENKFLKQWLFTNNYGVVIRTTVSRNKFNTEYLNISGIKAERINSTLLNNFDLVIGDATALSKLSGGEVNSIRSAVQEDGLGLLIKVDSITPGSLFFNSPFRYIASTALNNQQLHLNTSDSGNAMPVLTTTRPMFIANTEQLRAIIRDKEGRVFAATAAAGSGRLLATTIANTYNWVLSGDTTAYRRYWSDLITETSKSKLVAGLYSVDPSITMTDMPAIIEVESADSLPFAAKVNRSLVFLNQQFILPFQWQGLYWPRRTGWQSLASNNDQPFYWYSFGKNDWIELRASRKIAANKLKLSQAIDTLIPGTTSVVNGFQRYTRIYIILIFIICCTYLWIEEKFHNSR